MESGQVFNESGHTLLDYRDISEAGHDLERPFQFGAAVPYLSTFLLVGGGRDTVHKYVSSDDTWEEMPGRLSAARETPAAMLVPLDMFPDCGGVAADEKKKGAAAKTSAAVYDPDLDPTQSNAHEV